MLAQVTALKDSDWSKGLPWMLLQATSALSALE